jgi:hypothetical protein
MRKPELNEFKQCIQGIRTEMQENLNLVLLNFKALPPFPQVTTQAAVIYFRIRKCNRLENRKDDRFLLLQTKPNIHTAHIVIFLK